MATLRNQADWDWPAELATFDPERFESRAAWHLARADAAPNRLVALDEIRASLGRPPIAAGGGGTLTVGLVTLGDVPGR